MFTVAVMNGPWSAWSRECPETLQSPLNLADCFSLCTHAEFVPPTPKLIPGDRARPMALCQVAAHLDSLTENDADASCWRCHLITAIRPFSSAVAVILYLWAALEGVWTKIP